MCRALVEPSTLLYESHACSNRELIARRRLHCVEVEHYQPSIVRTDQAEEPGVPATAAAVAAASLTGWCAG
jgi:hypothetical protein